MRGEDVVAAEGPASFGGGVERICIQHHGACGVVDELQQILCSGRVLVADTGADDPGLHGLCRKHKGRQQGRHHHFRCNPCRQQVTDLLRAVEVHEPGPGCHGGFGAQLCRANHPLAAGDDADASRTVLEMGVGAAGQPSAGELGTEYLCIGAGGERYLRQGDAEQAPHGILCTIHQHAGFHAADGGGDISHHHMGAASAVVGIQSGGYING